MFQFFLNKIQYFEYRFVWVFLRPTRIQIHSNSIFPCKLKINAVNGFNVILSLYYIWKKNVMGWNFIYGFSTFLDEFGSQDYWKHILDRLYVCPQILVNRVSQELWEPQTSNLIYESDIVGQTGQTQLLEQICQSVRVHVNSSINRRKTNIVYTISSERFDIDLKFVKRLTFRLN